MKAKHTLTATWAILALSSHLLANPSISNINVTPDQQAGTIVISYNISGITDSSATVQAKASINNGSTYSIALQNATGALGAGITNGSGRDKSLPGKIRRGSGSRKLPLADCCRHRRGGRDGGKWKIYGLNRGQQCKRIGYGFSCTPPTPIILTIFSLCKFKFQQVI
jgi:hypothetical protein